jgi:hypothetical protein
VQNLSISVYLHGLIRIQQQSALRRKEHGTTHASSTDNSLLSLLELALLPLLCVLIPCWYCWHRSTRRLPSVSPKVSEEAPLLSDELVEPTKFETVLESSRELAPLVSASDTGEESHKAPEVVSDQAIFKRETSLDSARSQADHVTPTDVNFSTEFLIAAVVAAPMQEPERPAAEAMVDGPNTIAPKQTSASPNGQRKIPPVGEAPKNTGCCACRGGH